MKITLNEFIAKLQGLADQGHGDKPVCYEYDSSFNYGVDDFNIQATEITTWYDEKHNLLESPIQLKVVQLHE